MPIVRRDTIWDKIERLLVGLLGAVAWFLRTTMTRPPTPSLGVTADARAARAAV